MTFIKTKTGIGIILLIAVFAFLYFFTNVFGDTRLSLTLKTNPNLENGLVGHWTFDGPDYTNNLIDRSGQGNDMTISGDPQKTSGRIGQGVDLDGDGDYFYDSTPSGTSFGAGAEFTVSAWTKLRTCGTDGSKIVEKKQVSDEYINISCFGSVAEFDVRDNNLVLAEAISTTLIVDDIWHHVLGVKRGNNTYIYVDGVQGGSDSASFTGNWNDGEITIGDSIDAGGDRDVDGLVDDVRIYNRALSDAEILRLYQLGATTKIAKTITTNPDLENGLVGYWTFDGKDFDWSSSTAEILDRSGNNNNGDWIDHATTTKPGKIGQAIDFDGSDDIIDVGTNSLLSFTGANDKFTLAGWVYVYRDSQDAGGQIIGKWSFTNGRQYQLAIVNNGKAGLFLSTTGSCCALSFTGNTSMPDGEWVHLAGTVDLENDAHELFVNGQSDGTNSTTIGTLYNSTSIVSIGASKEGTDDRLDGNLDDVRIYNRILSDEEITRLYGLGATTKVAKTISTNPDLESGLVGHWTFDGKDFDWSSSTAEILDRSGNENNGDWQNHATTTINGKMGQAIDFDGVDDRVLILDADNISFGAGESFSLAAWVRTRSCPADDAKVVEKKQTSSESYSLACNDANGFAKFTVRDSDSVNANASSTFSIVDNEWHHLTGVKNGNTLNLYVDSEFQTSITASYTGNWNDGDLYIGNSPDGGARDYDGSIDDVRVYNRALSEAEILRLYQLGN